MPTRKSNGRTFLKVALVLAVLVAAGFWAFKSLRNIARVKVVKRDPVAVDAVTGAVTITANGGYKEVKSDAGGRVTEAQAINKDSPFTKNAKLVQLDTTEIERQISELDREFTAKKDQWKIELENREEEKLAMEEVATARRLFELGTASELQKKTAERALDALRRQLKLADFQRNKAEDDYKAA